MELKPIKNALRPHYAAAIAAAASALLLTGCGNAGEVALAGDAPTSYNPKETDIVVLDGEETVAPDYTEPVLEGEAVPDYTETHFIGTTPALEGVAPMPVDGANLQGTQICTLPPVQQQTEEPVRLEGDVAFIPSFEEENEDACAAATELIDEMCTGFSRVGITLTEEKETLRHMGGIPFYYPFIDAEQKIAVVFYDSAAVNDQGYCLGDYMSDWYTVNERCPWGVCTSGDYLNETYRCAFIDLSGRTQLTADGFAEIAGDILSMES